MQEYNNSQRPITKVHAEMGMWTFCFGRVCHNRSITRRQIVAIVLAVGCIVGVRRSNTGYWLIDERPEHLQSQCPSLHLSNDPLPVTAVASSPGSGNTWLRHLIQQSTGIYTGAVYNDSQLRENGFLGEGLKNGSVIVIKTHRNFGTPRQPNFTRAILLIRNPYDAILSEFNRRNSANRSHIGSASLAAYQSKKWTNFVKNYMLHWRLFNLSWLRDFKGPVHVTFYEDLKTDLRGELDAFIKFLGVTPTFVECALLKPQGKYLRNKTKKPDFDELFDEVLTGMAHVKIQEVYHVAYSTNHVTMSATGLSHVSNRNRIRDHPSVFRRFTPNRDSWRDRSLVNS